jgi:hypothetical protein
MTKKDVLCIQNQSLDAKCKGNYYNQQRSKHARSEKSRSPDVMNENPE